MYIHIIHIYIHIHIRYLPCNWKDAGIDSINLIAGALKLSDLNQVSDLTICFYILATKYKTDKEMYLHTNSNNL